jgi:hypothetical protein
MLPTLSGIRWETLSGMMTFRESEPLDDPVGKDLLVNCPDPVEG